MDFKQVRQNMIVINNTIKKFKPSRELSLVKISIEKSMMWTGTFMKFSKLGDNPYAKHDGNRKTVKDIEPLYDATDAVLTELLEASAELGRIYAVDQLRGLLQKYLEDLIVHMESFDSADFSATDSLSIHFCLLNLYTNLTEARMWLGMELGRIREEGEDAPEVRL